MSDIRLWNELPYGSPIRVGDALSVYVAKDLAREYSRVDKMTSEERQISLNVKAAEASAPRNPLKAGSYWTSYKVQKGDNLGGIASRYSVSVEDLRRWNGLRSNAITKGRSLEILIEDQSTASRRTAVAESTPASKKADPDAKKSAISYKVKKGDTLHSIASSFGVSITDIQSWNKIRGSNIHVGQKLVIYS